jgi:predicted house-cleaning NTP pyrophosphatase (Maf/HAM1 superfamily)
VSALDRKRHARITAAVSGYELEGLWAQRMARIEGDHSSILNPPLLPLMDLLRGEGALAA